MRWFRFYSEFIDDPKVAMMSDSDQLLWIKALCLASESKQRGFIKLIDEEICWRLRIALETWRHAIDKFRAKGMIEHCEDGYKILNWNARQFDSDSSSERVARHRQSKKSEVKQACNVTCDVTETPPDTDPDPEKDPDQTQNPDVRVRASNFEKTPEDPSRVCEFEKSTEPAEPSRQRAWAGCTIERQAPDQAQKGSELIPCSAAAPPPVENSNHPTARTEAYFRSGGKSRNQPDLPADLKHIWTGPGRLDFLPTLIEACSRYLRSIEKPCSQQNAITYIGNRIRDGDWTAIELRLQEMANYAQKRQSNTVTVNHARSAPEGFEGNPGTFSDYRADMPKAFVDMSPGEQTAYRAAIAAMRASTTGLGFACIGEAIAQAAEMGVAA